MYKVIKRLEIAAAHQLRLNNGSKCEALHGHNLIVTVHIRSENLDENGMVYDFEDIKRLVCGKLDHVNLNNIIAQPTSENIAKYISEIIGEKCFKVEVQESESSKAVYER
ncbi:MAG: 6-carboxytetrahydropterin synthase [Oscillospiraceae bacterium]|jgi:6-pyruvoyltetrahydropterin/6-carboxytetrahydropterin synthase|nr:6-carboxytetrahydropterin synthase [Oscillospiraceae bacterium]